MNTIHDNLPGIFFPFFTLFDGIIFGIFLLLLSFVFWKIWKKEKEVVFYQKTEVFVPEVFSLKKEIQKLKKLQQQEAWKEFCLEATKTIKKLLERDFETPLLFATGRELLEILREKISVSEKEILEQFFHLSDPIKFAHEEGKRERAEEILVLLTKWNYKKFHP